MSTAKRDPCEILEWDSNFFRFRIARVRGDSLTRELVREIDAWCREEQVRCLYFLSRIDDPETTRLVEDNGFRLVDIRLTFRLRASESASDVESKWQSPATIRPARPKDLPALRRIAGNIFHNSRFYADRNFPRHLCDSLYVTWIDRCFKENKDAVMVAELEGSPVGLVSCLLYDDQSSGKIDLLAVSKSSQGLGIGTELFSRGLKWLLDRGVTYIFAVTQARNPKIRSLHFGFHIHKIQIWYHKWFDI